MNVELTPVPGWTQFFTYWAEKFGDAWAWMLALGIAHSRAHGVPALGYWLTFLLVCLVTNSSLRMTPVESAMNTKRKVIR